MILLKGAAFSSALEENIRKELESIDRKPVLAIVRIGERPDDLAYERGARKRMEKLGMEVRTEAFAGEIGNEEFLEAFRAIVRDPGVDGVLLMRPLPARIDKDAVAAALDPDKDLDGITDTSMARVFRGDPRGFAPAVAEAAVRLVKMSGIDLEGKRVTIVGRSEVAGKPMAMLFLRENATVTICHTRTADLRARCREADVLICAAGKRGLITRDFVKEGAVLADVGINMDGNGKICGDADLESMEDLLLAGTPVPGGVGAATTMVLAEHLLRAAKRRAAAEEAGQKAEAAGRKAEEAGQKAEEAARKAEAGPVTADPANASLQHRTLSEFSGMLWSDLPSPGGGGAAALSGALAAALAGMVANLTIGKKKYADAWDEMKEIAEKTDALRKELLRGIQEDSTCFDGYMAALGLPKSTEEEKAARHAAMQKGLEAAIQVPLACAGKAMEIFPLARAVVERGNKGLVTDGLIAAQEARCAVLAALLNVRINLKSLDDREMAERLLGRCRELEQAAIAAEKEILEMSELSAGIV